MTIFAYYSLKIGLNDKMAWAVCSGVKMRLYMTFKRHQTGFHRTRALLCLFVLVLFPKLPQCPGDVFYYQGLHDVASVLLLVLGARLAFPLLCYLCTGHLRDCTRSTLDAVLEILSLMTSLLDHCDGQLAQFCRHLKLPPIYALSWYLTWFSHSIDSLSDAARLFDLFLSSHPLMPLYVGAVAMRAHRKRLLTCEDMPELHSMLSNLLITSVLSPDDLAVQARTPSGLDISVQE